MICDKADCYASGAYKYPGASAPLHTQQQLLQKETNHYEVKATDTIVLAPRG